MHITEEEYTRYPWLRPRLGWYGGTEIPQGWHDIIMIMCEEIKQFFELNNIDENIYHVDQGKEKWGYLEWYDSFDKQVPPMTSACIDIIVDRYKHILRWTCTNCGTPARMRRNNWIEPLCNKCQLNLDSKKLS